MFIYLRNDSGTLSYTKIDNGFLIVQVCLFVFTTAHLLFYRRIKQSNLENTHTHTHTHSHTHAHTHTHKHKRTNAQTHKRTNAKTHKHTNTQIQKHTHIFVHHTKYL